MKKAGILLSIVLLCGCAAPASSTANKGQSAPQSTESTVSEEEETMETNDNTLRLSVNGNEIIFQLNDSPAAQSLKKQMPMDIDIVNYNSNEKTFYPTDALDTSNTPLSNGKTGGLAYFEPWKDVVMYYGEAGPYSGLYALGTCIQGQEYIADIPEGKIHIE